MFNKTLLTALLLTGATLAAKAQYIRYEPLPTLPPASSSSPYNVPPPPSYRSAAPAAEIQRVSGYIIDPSRGTRKVNLQITLANRTVYIVGVKELSSEYWTSFNTIKPVAQKLTSYESYSDTFEYKVYMPTLGQTVYF
jgi:hypothetical protein